MDFTIINVQMLKSVIVLNHVIDDYPVFIYKFDDNALFIVKEP